MDPAYVATANSKIILYNRHTNPAIPSVIKSPAGLVATPTTTVPSRHFSTLISCNEEEIAPTRPSANPTKMIPPQGRADPQPARFAPKQPGICPGEGQRQIHRTALVSYGG